MIRVFVTGTDTDIGKTFVSTILANGLGARYWKPIQTGTSEASDKNFVAHWIGNRQVVNECYTFGAPLSPHLAASEEGRSIELADIGSFYQKLSGPLVVEGAGGVMVPLNKHELMIDLIGLLRLPTIVVSGTRLGTINHTLLTLYALRAKCIPIFGVITNGDECRKTSDSIESYGSTRVIGHVPYFKHVDQTLLKQAFQKINLEGLQ